MHDTALCGVAVRNRDLVRGKPRFRGMTESDTVPPAIRITERSIRHAADGPSIVTWNRLEMRRPVEV